MITNTIPNNWNNLQEEVARILQESGFSVEVNKKMSTVRGEVSIDVYAEENIKDRKYSIICECKYWKRKIPQSVVHGVRTIVQDIGANVGYIISIKGFQRASIKATEFTNIQLLTWIEFQNKYEKSWIENHFSPQIKEKLDLLFMYCEPLWPRIFQGLKESETKKCIEFRKKYESFSNLMIMFSSYKWLQDTKIISEKFPLLNNSPSLKGIIPIYILEIKSFREFLDASIKYGEAGILKFKKILECSKRQQNF